MKTYYAIEANDMLGNRRHWADYYTSAPVACHDAKAISRDHPAWDVRVLKETAKNPGQTIGANWLLFRTISL